MQTTTCSLCGSREIKKVLDLGLHPLADTFLPAAALAERQSFHPLQVGLCSRCGYVMGLSIVPAEERYQSAEYSYDSSNSQIAIQHFKEMAREIVDRNHLGKADLAVDIGSNVGTLLGSINEQSGAKVIGVEPSRNIAALAKQNGISTINDFFNARAVAKIKQKAKSISATNVFNHIEDQEAFFGALAKLLARDGECMIETPYLVTLLERKAFDTIYLEHVSYFTVEAHNLFFNKKGFYIYDIEKNDYMGGSIRLFIGRDKKKENRAVIQQYIAAEKKAGVRNPKTYQQFSKDIDALRFDLCKKLYTVKANGGKIAAVGAATKGNTLLNFCKIDRGLVSYIGEVSKLKIGKFAPGSLIPIVDEAVMKKDADLTHVLILPWNIGSFLKSKLNYLNVEFIIPQLNHENRTQES